MIEVSIIIPTYNRKDMLIESALSVLNQTYKDFELIIVDDGSKDGTEEKVNKLINLYKNFRIRYIKFKENKGPAFARNRGAQLAKGKYLAFLDSDDLWLKNKLKLQLEFMKKNNYLISQTDEIWIRMGKKVNPMNKHKKPTGDIFQKCLELCCVSPSSVVIAKEIFFEFDGFDENFLACEDYDLWLRMSLKYPIYLLPKKLIIKRGGSWEHQSKKIPHLDRLRIKSMIKVLQTYPMTDWQKKSLIQELLNKTRIYLNGLLKRGKFEEAKTYQEIIEIYGNNGD